MYRQRALGLVKLVHTVVWAVFVACIVAAPVAALAGRLRVALVLNAIVLGEVVVLAANRWRCPLTDVATRYTENRADNFDIYLPVSVARYNKQVFGSLYAAGLLVGLWCWLR